MLWLSVYDFRGLNAVAVSVSCVRSALPTHSSLERHTRIPGTSNRERTRKQIRVRVARVARCIEPIIMYACFVCMRFYQTLCLCVLIGWDASSLFFWGAIFLLSLAQNSWCWPVLLHNLLTHIASLFDLCWVLNREPAQVVPVFDDSRLHLVWSNCEHAIRPEVTLCGWRDLLIHVDLLTCFAPAARPHCSTDAQKVSVTVAPVFIHARTACYHSCNT